MFPPVDEGILKSNPDFANLYNKLTRVILAPDGSTKDDPAAAERAAVQEKLQHHRLKAAKQHLLSRAIATAVPPAPPRNRSKDKDRPTAPSLPEPLLDLLVLLPPLLAPSAQPPPRRLLASPPFSHLESLLPDLASLLSSSLRASALDIARVAHPSTNPSYLHRHVAALPQARADLVATLRGLRLTLASSRRAALAALTALLDAYAAAVTLLVRALEAKHGVVARSLDLRAAHVRYRAEVGAAEAEQARWTLARDLYTPEVVDALRNYSGHLRDARGRAVERVKGLKDELADYGVGVEGGETKEKTLRELARAYREMSRQVSEVKGDLDRLQKG